MTSIASACGTAPPCAETSETDERHGVRATAHATGARVERVAGSRIAPHLRVLLYLVSLMRVLTPRSFQGARSRCGVDDGRGRDDNLGP
jgi:hypothetical protein